MDEPTQDERGQVADPAEVATYLLSNLRRVVPNVTVWDMVCLSSQVLALATLDNPIFKPIALALNRLVYAIHDEHNLKSNQGIESCLKSRNSQTLPQVQLESQPHSVESSSTTGA